MKIKEKVENLIKKHAKLGNDIDWIILSGLDFITLVFQMYNHIELNGIRIVSDESIQEGVAQVVDAKGIKDVQL